MVERYRLVLYPVLCIMAARFLLWAAHAFRSREWRSLALRVAFAGALAVAMSGIAAPTAKLPADANAA